MSTLKWTVEIRLGDASVARTEDAMTVERDWREVWLSPGEKRSETTAQTKKCAFFQIRAKSSGATLKISREEFTLDRPVLFTDVIKGLSGSGKQQYHRISEVPGKMEFMNTSSKPVTVEILSATRVKRSR